MPSLPSTPSRVPSGHGTKSSILYLHSPTVQPKDIVRLSGDPLIQDSLSPGKAAWPHAGTDSSSSHLDLHRRWSTGRYTNGGRPGSVLAQKLVGAPLPLIKCDHCPKKVVRHVSTTPEHPEWVFIKCLNDGVCALFGFGLCFRFD